MPGNLYTTLTVAGQVGSLITLLDRMLCLGMCLTTPDDAAFTDRSAEARTESGTAFPLFAVSDVVGNIAYFGHDQKFTALRVDLDAAGVAGDVTWEYWNGSAWTALTVSESVATAKKFFVDGELTWTAPGDWAKTSVNGSSFYWARARCTTGYTTAPTCFHAVYNWTIYDDAAGTNAKVYKTLGEDGSAPRLLWVSDNATSAATEGNARVYETWDNVAHTGTAPTPTVAQVANGVWIIKSSTADATARTVVAFVDRDAALLLIYTGHTVDQATGIYLGRMLSYVASDAWDGMVIGAAANATAADRDNFSEWGIEFAALTGHYVQRVYIGNGGAVQLGKPSLDPGGSITPAWTFPNGPDGALLTNKIFLSESGPHLRGELRNCLAVLHPTAAALVDGDTFSLAGVSYRLARILTSGLAWAAVKNVP